MHDARSSRPGTSPVSGEARQTESNDASVENDLMGAVTPDTESADASNGQISTQASSWGSAWQVPVIILSTALIVAGFFALER